MSDAQAAPTLDFAAVANVFEGFFEMAPSRANERPSDRQARAKSLTKCAKKTIENSKKIGSRARWCQRAKNEAKIDRKTTQIHRKIAPGTPAAPPGAPREGGSSAAIAINIKVGASEQAGALPGRLAAPRSPSAPNPDQVI